MKAHKNSTHLIIALFALFILQVFNSPALAQKNTPPAIPPTQRQIIPPAPPKLDGVASCPLILADAPSLRGFRLGQTLQDVTSKYPDAILNQPKEGGRPYIYLSPLSRKPSTNYSSLSDEQGTYLDTAKYPELEGVVGITLQFISGKLAVIMVTYVFKEDFERVEQFATISADRMKINGVWKKLPRDYDTRLSRHPFITDTMAMPCGAVQLDASFISSIIGEKLTPLHMQIVLADVSAIRAEKNEAEREKQKKRESFNP